MIRPFLLLAATVLAVPALAVPAMAADSRLASRLYNPDEVVRIEGKAGVQATIAFGEDEHIENVAIGDSNAWQVTPNKRANMLFVKPLAAAARTNMTVITDARSYYFDLVAGGVRPLYLLRFTYPADKPRPAAAQAAAPLTGEEADLAAGTRPADPASLNFAWDTKGKAALFPARIYDDGQSVYLVWRPGSPQPAILTRDARGREGPVNYAVRGETIVIEGVPGMLVLRAGKDVALLENRGAPRTSSAPESASTTQPPALAAASPVTAPPITAPAAPSPMPGE